MAQAVDDQRRWQALADLRRVVGLDPVQILAAPAAVLRGVVAAIRPMSSSITGSLWPTMAAVDHGSPMVAAWVTRSESGGTRSTPSGSLR